MAIPYGKIRQMCPYCCEDIEMGQVYVIAPKIGSPIDGMTIHEDCAMQREQARDVNREVHSK